MSDLEIGFIAGFLTAFVFVLYAKFLKRRNQPTVRTDKQNRL